MTRTSDAIVPGTRGYEADPQAFIAAGERVSFDEVHAAILSFLPAGPGDALDIGACSGRDAAALAARGFRVTAVEPVAAFRAAAATLHPSTRIDWRDDALPELATLSDTHTAYDLILLQAVWMHLDETERCTAMGHLARLARPGARLVLSLRHGPVPPGRRMFAVTALETMELAQGCGLATLACVENLPSALPGKPDVTWTRLVFEKSA